MPQMDDPTDQLAGVAREVAAEWGVALGERFASKHSFIAAAGNDAILKVVRPGLPAYEHEADALALWQGDHAVRLLRHDRARRALLLERALPGHDLSGVPKEVAIATAIDVGRALWRKLPDPSPFGDVTELGVVRGGLAYMAIAVAVLVGALGIAAVGERTGLRDLTFFGPWVVVALGYLGWARLERSAALAAVVLGLVGLEAGLIAVGTDRLTVARVLALAWGSAFVVTGLAYAVRRIRR